MSRSHHRLRVWQVAMRLAEDVYRMSSAWPDSERFGLSSQMRRAAVSVVSNIAEGAGRQGTKEFQRFLFMARGSLCELDTQLRLSARLALPGADQLTDRVESLFGLLNGLISSLRRRGLDDRLGHASL